MRKQIAALVVAATASLGIVAAPGASAQVTNTTFTLSATGGLAISAPSTRSLSAGTATSAGTISTTLGNVTVTDNYGRLAGTWIAKAISTDFTTGTATADETITADNVAYTTGVPTIVSGVIVPVGTAVSAPIDELTNVVTATAGVGNNSVQWNPTITITVPSDAVVGNYAGTITHSVA